MSITTKEMQMMASMRRTAFLRARPKLTRMTTTLQWGCRTTRTFFCSFFKNYYYCARLLAQWHRLLWLPQSSETAVHCWLLRRREVGLWFWLPTQFQDQTSSLLLSAVSLPRGQMALLTLLLPFSGDGAPFEEHSFQPCNLLSLNLQSSSDRPGLIHF